MATALTVRRPGGAAVARKAAGAVAKGAARGGRAVGRAVATSARAVARGARAAAPVVFRGAKASALTTAKAIGRAKWSIVTGGFVSGLLNSWAWANVATRFSKSEAGDAVVHGGVAVLLGTVAGGARMLPGSVQRVVKPFSEIVVGAAAGQSHEAGRLLALSRQRADAPERVARAQMRGLIAQRNAQRQAAVLAPAAAGAQ